MIRKRQSNRKRQAAADDRIAAVEIGFGIEQMHGAAAATATSIPFAVHLGHHGSMLIPATSA